MPGMTDPRGRTYWLDEWAVVGARMNFFSYADDLTPGGPHEIDTPSIDEMSDAPEDPDGYMPTPQSCEDIDFLLNDCTGRKTPTMVCERCSRPLMLFPIAWIY
jgi:hypothetical protein